MAEVAGKSALLVDPENVEELAATMARLAESDELRAQLKASGVGRSKIWSWENTAVATMDVYRQVLKL